MPVPVDLFALNSNELTDFLREFGWPRYRAVQVLRWIYQRSATDLTSMTDLSKEDRGKLAQHARICCLQATEMRTATDGTQKFVFVLEDGKSIESVLIPDEQRLTLCLSTQIGCTLDCAFCLTGQMGLQRNLNPHEIVGQVLAVNRHLGSARHLTNLVLMGMGEPLANIDAVEEAVQRLTNTTWGLGIPARRITLSTAGLAPRIKRVAAMGVNLAVSLNATTNAQRTRLMPTANHAYPLEKVLHACRAYPLKPHRRLTFEYVLLKNENDTEQDAVRLAKLVRGIRCKINLIPFNDFPGSTFKRPSDGAVLRFQQVLTTHGLDAFIRKSKGRSVLGACGQLGNSSAPAMLLQPTRSPRRHARGALGGQTVSA